MEKENILPAVTTGRCPVSRHTKESRALPPPGRCGSRREQEDPAGQENGRSLRPAATRPGAIPEAVEELPDRATYLPPPPTPLATAPQRGCLATHFSLKTTPSASGAGGGGGRYGMSHLPAQERKAARPVGVV